MKYGIVLVVALTLTFTAYYSAQNKRSQPLPLDALRLGLTLEQVEDTFGTPSAEARNHYTFILQDGSELIVVLREDKVSSATVKFHRPLKIEDPQMRKLTLVQMDTHDIDSSPSFFYAGQPEEGRIYKITSKGEIESLTWVPPFSFGGQKPKQVGALLRDFHTQRTF
jgi:hypothetical protein